MNRPAQVPASESGLPDDVHRPIRDAIAQLRAGGSSIEYVKAAIADVLYRDLHQAAALSALLDESRENGSLGTEDYRRLSAELHRLVTEEVPTDGVPAPVTRSIERKQKARPARVSAGSLLGRRYQLEECVAEGPLSDVYRAGDRWRAELTTGNASVAVKVLTPLDDGIVDRNKLRRQALLAQLLAHPSICRVLGVDRDGETDFVVLEWLEGESLASLMDRSHPKPLDATLVRGLLEATAAALEHALEHNLVHGDLKPANVFVCSENSIKLLDFGLERGKSAAPAMTPDYASCEVLEGRAPEPADDVFSFAVMAYRAMTGSRPYGRRTALEAEADGARPERVPGLDDEQWACLERALAFRRADRDIGAMRLAATLTRSPLAQRAATTGRENPSSSWRIAAAAAVLLTGGALLAGWWWQNQDRPAPVVVSPVVEPLRQAPSPGRGESPAPANPEATSAAGAPGARGPGIDEPEPEPVPVAGEPEPVEQRVDPAPGISLSPEPEVQVQNFPPTVATAAEKTPESETARGAEAGGDPAPADDTVAASRTADAVEVTPSPVIPGGRLGFRDGLYEAGESDGFVKLRLRAPARHPGIRLRLSAGPGSAELGTDFALAEQIVDIEPGRTGVEVLWPLVDDARDEYLEEVELLLESLTDDYPVTQGDALVLIFDDDGPEVVSEGSVQP